MVVMKRGEEVIISAAVVAGAGLGEEGEEAAAAARGEVGECAVNIKLRRRAVSCRWHVFGGMSVVGWLACLCVDYDSDVNTAHISTSRSLSTTTTLPCGLLDSFLWGE